VSWLWNPKVGDVPLFVSRRKLDERKKPFPRARTRWALDSGGFTELSMFGTWKLSAHDYIARVRRYSSELGMLDWAAPQDWMCEPQILERTGLTVTRHQENTVSNFLLLRRLAPELPFIPVLQGWTKADYLACLELYEACGVDLAKAPLVGVGTVCRRQGTLEAEDILRDLERRGLRLHAFGAKTTGLRRYADAISSADSLAWSFNARKNPPLPECKGVHRRCANCLRWALRWRERVLATLPAAAA